jgi:hypothetical protein
MDADQLPDPETLAWVRGHVGPFEIVSRYAHDHGYSRLWRLRAGAAFFWLKMHTYPAKWAGEVHALTHWTPSLGLTPSLIAFSEEPRRVLLTEVEGHPAEKIELDLSAKRRMWEAAGHWLRQLHAIENSWLGGVREDGHPQGDSHKDPEAFVLRTFTPRIEEGRASGLLTPDEYDFVQFGIREWLPALAGERPRAVHRDFTPRNWMAKRDGTLTAVIDFEHARWDVRAAEMGRWWDWDFLHHPELIEVFFDAYGSPDERLKTQIQAIRMLQAATGIVWATRVNDLSFAQHNRASLERMIAGR